jgi:hypothetical protein
MKSKIVALLLFGLVVPAVCTAQSLKAGTWTGTALPPDADEIVSLTFDVTVHGDSLGIVIHAGDHGDFTTEKARYSDGTIVFTFSPGGPTVTCTLPRNEEGNFDGSCLGDDGSVAKMTMVPPKE